LMRKIELTPFDLQRWDDVFASLLICFKFGGSGDFHWLYKTERPTAEER
jgi:hypothetical protein